MIMPTISSLTIHDFAKGPEPVTMTILSIVAADRPCAVASPYHRASPRHKAARQDRRRQDSFRVLSNVCNVWWHRHEAVNQCAEDSILPESTSTSCKRAPYLIARDFPLCAPADCIPWSLILRKSNAGNNLPDDIYSRFDPNADPLVGVKKLAEPNYEDMNDERENLCGGCP
ncbi:uncharacterized protein ARMOST_12213 [Armillaria ostoyae]|uniref:Uncharacterized protein n=1 Tax=Armillaria ostoyae TaxID=47428 RepID=A0A284RJC7_ARMOS|nr:uncharacterized protein ARMOST_12213 [Armillaria ostoyae]